MTDPTRPLPLPTPLDHGGWEVHSFLTPEAFHVGGLALVPSNLVMPIVVVPGVMGTNLRARLKPRLSRSEDERSEALKPGEAAWRPPNGKRDGLRAAQKWNSIEPKKRQLIFDAPTLEVDDGGPVKLPSSNEGYVMTEDEVRRRGWSEVHTGSYGELLCALQVRLNQPFGFDDHRMKRFITSHWRDVMACEPGRWGVRDFEPLTETHLDKLAQYYFPVYACGYNWLESCATSSERLEQRIVDIIDLWKNLQRRCDKVIVVTHSMGGLVTRACAKRIPDKIAGVIHGVMPALGAPAAYRRIACGAESSSPGNGFTNHPIDTLTTVLTAKVLGDTTEKTTPVLAVSPGALELLPNHLYPGPWLHVRVKQAIGAGRDPGSAAKGDDSRPREANYDYLHLPGGQITNPYDLYRDTTSWYRLVDPALVDPARIYRKKKPGSVEEAIRTTIDKAEQFHRALGDYYHPHTYAFYGDDNEKLSFGQARWVARLPTGLETALTAANVAAAQYIGHTEEGHRFVSIEDKTDLYFELEPQDVKGDGTVPHQSGVGPDGKARQVFATRGYDHQGCYNNDDMVLLTLRLIVRIVQEAS